LPDLGEGEPVYESIEDLYKNRTYLNIEEEYDDSDQEYDEPQKIEQDIYQSLVQYNQGEEFNREYDVPEENNVELNQVDLESIEQNTKHEQGNSKTLLEIKLDEIQKALDTSFVIKHELIKDFPFKQESQIGIEQNIRAKMLEYIKPWEKKVDTFFNGKEDRITKGAIEKFIKIKDNLRNFQNVIVEEYKSLSEKINQDRKFK